jgi:uncharacterized membrane protein
METETKELKVWETFLIYLFLAMLTVTSVVVLVFYFSDFYKVGHSRNDRLTMGFVIGVLISLVLAAIGTWLASRKPHDKDEEGADDEVEGEEE